MGVLVLREVGFAGFVRENTSALLRTAYLLTGNASAAEELVQDTLVRLYPKWDKVQAADVPLAYVRRSLTNGFINERRRASSHELRFDLLPDRADERDRTAYIADRAARRGRRGSGSCGCACGSSALPPVRARSHRPGHGRDVDVRIGVGVGVAATATGADVPADVVHCTARERFGSHPLRRQRPDV